MKRFKKELSWLLVLALVVSSVTLGFGRMTAAAVDNIGTGVFRLDIQIAANDTSCGGDASKGTDSQFRLQLLNAGGTVISQTPNGAITGAPGAGVGGTDPLENNAVTSFTSNGAATGANVNVAVPSLGALTINQTVTQMQLVCTTSTDDWTFQNVVLYYSPDGGSSWAPLTSGGWGKTSGAVTGTWSVGAAFTTTYKKTLDFNANGGTGGSVYDAIAGQTISTAYLGTPSRTGYIFNGWGTIPARMPNSNLTIYANWLAQYYVQYNANGANTSGSTATSTHTQNVAQNLTANGYTRTGYTFNGWNTQANGSGTNYANGASVTNLTTTGGATVILYAKWNPITYYVQYNANGGAGSMSNSTHQYEVPTPLTNNAFTKTGYTFAGWATTAGGSLVYNNGQSVTTMTSTAGATVQLYARWTPITYTISYDVNATSGWSGTTATSTHTYDLAQALTANGYTRTGYSFLGWATSASGELTFMNQDSVLNLTTVGGTTVTLFVVWQGNQYTVVYNANGGSGSTANSFHTYGVAQTLTPNAFTRTGYTFAGWALTPTGAVAYANGASVINLVPSGSITLYAKWTANQYTIVYNGNGNTSGSMSNSVHIYDVAKALTNNAYTKTGCTFLGWALSNTATEPGWENGESVLNLTSTPGATITFYAVWEALYYNITFDANGGTGGTGPTPMQYGTTLTVPTVAKAGHTLTGWDPPIPEPPKVPAANTTYTAQWQVSTFTITWNANGGLGGTSTQVPYGAVPTPPTVTREGYTFNGWTPTIVPVTGATTYTAQWTVNNYIMTFDANGGSGGTSTALPFGSALTPPTVTRTGYTFASWSPAPPQYVPAVDSTFVAQWAIKQYTLTYESNGGTAVTPVTADYGTSIPEPTAPTKTGYNFGGWYSDSGLTSAVTWPYTLGANNVTFYAKWTARTYTIAYNGNTADSGTTASSAHTYDVGSALTANGYTKTGYSFLGWALTDTATVPAYTDGQTVTNVTTGDGVIVTFYAVWQAINYQVSYDANGGTGSYGPVLGIYNSPVPLPTTGFTKIGHTFIGWNTTSGATTALTSFNMPVGGATLYAIYTINQYTVTFDANGGIGSYGPVTQDYGTAVTLPTTGFTRAGYNLAGWNTTNDAPAPLASYTVPAQNQTLYAVWTFAAADYSAVDAAILLAEATTLPASAVNDPMYRPGGDMYIIGGFTNGGFYARSMFTSLSLSALDSAVNAVVRGKNSSEQATVDGYAAAITAAYNNLVLASADYTALNALIAQAEGLNRALFTEDSLNMLDAVLAEAYDAVAEGYKLPLQDIVDDKAAALENTLNSMEYVDADYQGVLTAWASRPANLTQNYTPDSVANLVNYYNQEIIWNLKADQQDVVDGYEANLYILINALVYKPADYTAVDNAIKAIPDNDGGLSDVDYPYLYTIYNNTTVSNLANAVNAVVTGRPITEQAVVDGYAAAINAARIALVPLNADYTYLGIALNTPPAWPQSYYTEASYLAYTNEINDGLALYNNQNLNITQQFIINDQIYLIEQAYAALTLKDVTYTVKYQTTGGTTLAADVVKNATAAQWITETAVAVTGYTPVQATIQQRMTGTSSENIIIFTYTINSYTVTFVSNGGTAVGAITQNYLTQVEQPSDPARAGYTFAGWYADTELTNLVAWPYTLGASDVTFYAKWTANSYTVTFDAQGGTVTPGFTSVTYDSTYGTLPTPEREGYTFGGWFTGTNGGGVQVNASTVVAITAPQTLYAKWIVNSYLVTFDANGGSGGTSAPQNYGTAIVPPTVTKTGYTFTEWTPAVAATVPAADVTYTAQWTINQYTVSFDANSGTGTADAITQDYGTAVTLPEEGFAKVGYTFIGWNTDAGAATALASYSMPAYDETLYAIYEINQYTVYFDANGGTGSAAPITQDYNTEITLPTAGVAKTGYTFIGWNTDPEAAQALTSYMVPAEDSTLFAVYEINQYTVSFDANGGEGSADPVTQDYGTAVPLPTEGFTKTGYTFIGWNTTTGAETALAEYYVPANNATLYAVYQVNQYTVYFDANGGSGSYGPVTQNYLTAVNLPVDGFGKTGYTFIGWNTDAQAAEAISEYIVPLGGGTLYAIYEINQYTVYFDANGGTGTADPVTQDYLTEIPLPTEGFTKTGYTFIGWNTNPGATEALASYAVPAGNSTLYAVYQVNQYTVYFDANGGTGSAEPATQNFGSSVGFPTGGFTKTGYTFIGWNTDPQATQVLTSYLVPAEDSTLYAIYQINQYTVTFDANGGEGSADPVTQEFGTAVTLPTTGFTKTGYTFIGWNTTTGASIALESFDMPAGNVTLYAVYEVNSYTITFDANGGDGGTEQLLVYGSALIAPLVTREGYSFDGWLPVLPETVPAADTTYVAQWAANSYTVSFDSAGGTAVGSITQAYSTPITAPDEPTRLGYTFAGWLPEVPATMPATDTLCVAQWTANNYLITFDANGGFGGTGPTPMAYGTTLTAPAVTKPGYTLAGWSPELPATVPAEDTVYVAQWSLSSFQITFDANGGEGGWSAEMTYGAELIAPTVTRTGYTLTGWIPAVPETVPAEDTVYVAQWTINSYTVSFDSAGGTSVSPITQEYGTAITPPAVPTKTGYTFTGWAPEVPATMPAANVECVAQWTINSYNLTFDANGGTGGIGPVLTEYGTAIAAPAVEREGYTFIGWDPVVPFTMPAEDATYTAQWSLNQSTIYFDLNGGTSAAIDPITLDEGAAVTEPANPTRDGYIFAGWSPAVPTIMPVDDVYCVAQWTAETVTIIFDANGGTGGWTDDLVIGDPLVAPEVTRPGYTFDGWDPAVPETVPGAAATYTAQWVEIQIIPGDGAQTVIDNARFFIYGLEQYITQEDFESLFVAVLGDGRVEVTPTVNGFGTGTRVDLIDNTTEDILATYYIVIFGDLNGDGIAGSVDIDLIANYENYVEEWDYETEPYLFLAGDLDGNTIVEALDADIISNVENYLMWIDQTSGIAYEY